MNWILKPTMRLLKNQYAMLGVPVIIQNEKNEILLGKRNKNCIFYPDTWGLPGGVIEYKEKVIDAIKREIQEELGVEIKIIKKSNSLYEDFPNKECPFHMIDLPHYAKIIKGVPKPKDETSEVKWFKPDKIKNMKLAYTHKEILKGEKLI